MISYYMRTVLLTAAVTVVTAFIGSNSEIHPFAPDFTLKGLDGKSFSLKEHKGKVVVVMFLRAPAACLFCQRAASNLFELSKKYAGAGLVVVGVSLDDESIAATTYGQIAQSYPILFGEEAMIKHYGSPLPAASFVIGRDGRVYSEHAEYVALGSLQTEVEQLLASSSVQEAKIFKPSTPSNVNLPSDAELNDDVPGVDLTTLTPEQVTTFREKLNEEQCRCGCTRTMLVCRRTHSECSGSLQFAKRQLKQTLSLGQMK